MFLFILLLMIGIALAMLLLLRWDQEKSRRTKTGETAQARAIYHQRDGLSPRGHALAKTIREGLRKNEEKRGEG